jgi:hypothetical protein
VTASPKAVFLHVTVHAERDARQAAERGREAQSGDLPSGAVARCVPATFDIGALAGHDSLAVAAAEAGGTPDRSEDVVHG